VSTESEGPAMSAMGGQAATEEIARFFAAIGAQGFQPRLRHATGSCQFDIVGAGTWRVTVKDGVAMMTQNVQGMAPPDSVFTCTAEDFLRLIKQDFSKREPHLNLFTALLQGMVTITGDLSFAAALLWSATLMPTGTAGAQAR
jgi:hypothetical protein